MGPQFNPDKYSSIFSGLFPNEIKNHFPSQWDEMNKDESKLNKYEQYFCE